MPKMKTNKALSKKVRVTGKNKVLRRATKQNHYNSKQSGDHKRAKRRDRRFARPDEKNILKAIH